MTITDDEREARLLADMEEWGSPPASWPHEQAIFLARRLAERKAEIARLRATQLPADGHQQ